MQFLDDALLPENQEKLVITVAPYGPEWMPEDLFELYKDVVNSGYRFHDLMLGRLLQLAGPDPTVILCSDHGSTRTTCGPAKFPTCPRAPPSSIARSASS